MIRAFFLRFACPILLLGLASAAARAQTSAVDAIAFGGSGTVNTTWLGNPAGTGTYTFVYKANGTHGTTSSQSGTKPTGMTISTSVTGAGTSYTPQSLNNTHYIRKRVQTYNCSGSTSWSENVYAGPPVNAAPYVQTYTAVPDYALPLGTALSVGGSLADANANLTRIDLDRLPPGATTWTSAAVWTGASAASANVSAAVSFNLPGLWSFRLGGNDALGAVAMPQLLEFSVRPGVFHDPANVLNGQKPQIVATAGNLAVGTTGGFQLVSLVIRNAQNAPIPNAPVRVEVPVSHDGGLATTNVGNPTLVYSLELTANASGVVQFYLKHGAGKYYDTPLRVTSGATQTALRLFAYTAADASADTETIKDGLTNTLETVLGSSPTVTNVLVAPADLGWLVHTP